MNFDESFPRRVSMARNAIGLTQAELAKKVGVVPRQIAAYEGGEAKPRVNALNNLAAALGTTVEWLSSGVGEPPNIGHIRETATLPLIPVITYAQAAQLFIGDDEENLVGYDYIPSSREASSDAFAVVIESESMQTEVGMSFTTGSIVIFDPTIEATHGDFVLCRLPDYSSITFKQYVIDQGNEYLLSLNSKYPMIPINHNCFIIGVAIESRLNLSLRAGFGNPPNWMKTISDPMPDWLVNVQPELFHSEHPIDFHEKDTKISNQELASRLDKIESMLEQLLKNK
ncbi:LexA family protein [Morganella morganii]|uniref:LexA family protein n=1 Tax=Morganella morganii TaxID=582 RepID=UPI000BBD18ED|nr:S24 family peptidase [Morganella morganii]ATF52645.1 hypothetical protein CO693_02485 [Morganella morganii]